MSATVFRFSQAYFQQNAKPAQFQLPGCHIFCQDSRDHLKTLADNTVDSILCDPPYGLSNKLDISALLHAWANGQDYQPKNKRGFMGREWDSVVPGPPIWRECFRVLKPGGHALIFGGSRTFDLLTLSLRLAGFEIRDTMMWMYGSGFPKSSNISKMIDKSKGAKRKIIAPPPYKRGKTSQKYSNTRKVSYDCDVQPITASATLEAEQWEGWGSALKPAFEPIVLVRKPLEGTLSQNVLKWGTGGLNIDACRVPHKTIAGGNLALNSHLRKSINGGNGGNIFPTEKERRVVVPDANGRWPANVLHDGSDEVEHIFLDFGQSKDGVYVGKNRKGIKPNQVYGKFNVDTKDKSFGGSGSASRFFYCAKVSTKERGGSKHPTQKPLSLLEYLALLITPPNGVILDPFMG